MADFSMWGAEASPNRMSALDAQNQMLKAAQTRAQNASAAENEAQTEGIIADNAGKKRMAEAMGRFRQAGGGDGPASTSLADPIEEMSRLAYESGLPSEGAKYATQASQVRQHEAATKNSQVLQEKNKLETQYKALQHSSSLYQGVTDQRSFDRANALYAMTFSAPSPVAGQAYSPDLVGKLTGFGMTQMEKVRARLLEIDTASKQANRGSAMAFRDFRKGIVKEELTLKQEREERLAKQGGAKGGVGAPTSMSQKAAVSLLAQEFPDLPADETKLAAYSVASRAKALQQANKALDSDTALRQALAEEKTAGSFQKVNDTYKVLGVDTGMKKPAATKFTKGQAVAVADAPTDPTKRTVGSTYNTPKGQLKWLGGGKWEKVAEGAKAPTQSASLLPSALDDEEEE